MLSIESKLKVSDNSGIRIVKCLKFLDGFSKQMKGGLGSLVVVSGFDYRGYTQKSSRKVFLGTIVTLKN
jgi:ribosomal protein L14